MRDTKKLQIFIQQAHGVSSALWPASARRCISTGKAAQRRRSLIIQGKWWSPLANVTHIALLLALIGCSMFMGGMVVAALVQHRWYVLLIPAMTLAAFFSIAMTIIVRYKRVRRAVRRGTFLLGDLPGTPPIQGAPHTPMPADSLVRVLETVDLSESGVEHFLVRNDEVLAAPVSSPAHK